MYLNNSLSLSLYVCTLYRTRRAMLRLLVDTGLAQIRKCEIAELATDAAQSQARIPAIAEFLLDKHATVEQCSE